MGPEEVLIRAGRLAAEGKPYALATVVRVVPPASTRRGDRALVTPAGELFGWVGGACSEPTVVREALRALADREPRLVRICPSGVAGAAVNWAPTTPQGLPPPHPLTPGTGPDPLDESPTTPPPDPLDRGVVIVESSCASEGTVEVLIEPELPKPLLAIVGEAPAARTLAELARVIGWRVAAEVREEAEAVVVATMGRGDAEALAAALATPAGYIGLVASSRRAAHVLESLRERGVDEAELARVRSPAGLDLGPSSQEEIAVAILAELVAWRHTRPGERALAEAVDPVCGMTVAVEGASGSLVYGGVTYYFCCPGCRRRFEADPARHLTIEAQ